MKRRVRGRLVLSMCVSLLVAGSWAPPSGAAPRPLAVSDLGTFNGTNSFGDALNNHGQIVGVAFVGPQEIRPYLWDKGTIIELGQGNMGPIDINDHGQILLQGFLATVDGSNSCFLRDGEEMIDLGNLDATQCFCNDLNNRGQVVGAIPRADGPFHGYRGFLWESGTMIDIGSLGGDYVIAHAINDRGQIVGLSTTAAFGESHAFLWESGRMIDLAPPGASSSDALAINNHGQVVVSGGTHIYFWEAGVFTDLGTMGGTEDPPTVGGAGSASYAHPLDISEQGQILVEFYDGPAGVFRYFIWEGGTMSWLPSLGSGSPSARHMNGRGQVVGTDRSDAAGVLHIALWTRGASSGRADH